MIIFRDIDIISAPYNDTNIDESYLRMNSTISSSFNRARREHPLYPPVEPCPQEIVELPIAIAFDRSYLTRMKRENQSVETWLDSTMNTVFTLFIKTVNVRLVVSKVYLAEEIGTPSWNPEECIDIDNMLSNFSYWRGNSEVAKSRPEGLFHLFTACFTINAMGLAYVNTLCQTDTKYHEQSGVYYSGTALSSGLGLNWRIPAHEMAHQLGAPHDDFSVPPGLMGSTLGTAVSFSRYTQQQMCSRINEHIDQCFVKPPRCIPKCPTECSEYGCCGSDGCGGVCGTCPTNGICNESTGMCSCIPQCELHQCGDDGCSGKCGVCGESEVCLSWKCVQVDELSLQYLIPHNEARSSFGLSQLTWSSNLAVKAKEIVDTCPNHIDFDYNSEFGVNIVGWKWRRFKPSSSVVIINTVSYWISFRHRWTCNTDKCMRGTSCRQYTQLVHENVTTLGCSYKHCTEGNVHVVLCLYDVMGKYVSSRPFSEDRCEEPAGGWPTDTVPCQPKGTCASKNYQCGDYDDGCSIQECGICAEYSTCESHRCICKPRVSCDGLGKTCGSIDIGCGRSEFCGNCSSTDVCENNRCSECIPLTSCEDQGRYCGDIYNGCEKVSCGKCYSDHECRLGRCSKCSMCHAMAICITTEVDGTVCKCSSGFIGDGYQCEVIVDPGIIEVIYNGGITTENTNTWLHFCGEKQVWRLGTNALVHSESDTSDRDISLWNEATPFFESAITSIKVHVKKLIGARRIGITWKLQDCNNFYAAFWDAVDNNFKIQLFAGENQIGVAIAKNISWSDGAVKTIGIDVLGNTGTIINFEGKDYEIPLENLVNATGFGVYAQGPAHFFDVSAFTKSKLTMTLARCISKEEFVRKIANLLSISVEQVKDVKASTNCLSRRDASAIVAPTIYSFPLTGSPSASSAALATIVTTAVAEQSGSLAAAGLLATSASVVAPVLSSAAITGTVAGASSALLISIICGSVALASAGTVGGIIILKQQGKPDISQTSDPEPEEPLQPAFKKRGIDVWNPEVHKGKHISLTQRNYTGYPSNEPEDAFNANESSAAMITTTEDDDDVI